MSRIRLQFDMEEEDWENVVRALRLEGHDTASQLENFRAEVLYKKVLKKEPPITAKERARRKRIEERIERMNKKQRELVDQLENGEINTIAPPARRRPEPQVQQLPPYNNNNNEQQLPDLDESLPQLPDLGGLPSLPDIE